jgi:hypothetical protein
LLARNVKTLRELELKNIGEAQGGMEHVLVEKFMSDVRWWARGIGGIGGMQSVQKLSLAGCNFGLAVSG